MSSNATVTAPSNISSRKALREAIAFYAKNINYLKAHLTSAYRIDLQGQNLLDQPLTEAQRDYAMQKLERINTARARKNKDKPRHRNKSQEDLQQKETAQSSNNLDKI